MVRSALTLSVVASAAFAQGPKGADTLSPKAVADSQKVLAALDARVRKNSNDGAAWYRRGMIAWALGDRAYAADPPRDLDPTLLLRMADTSLRIAARIETNNAQYRMMVGRFLLASGVAVTRFASGSHFEAALEVARKGDDPTIHAETAVEFGRISWRRYDALANRRMEVTPGSAVRSLSTALNPGGPGAEQGPSLPLKAIAELIESGTKPLPPGVSGEAYFNSASDLFREAYAAAPTNARAFRAVAMTLAEKNRWVDLEAFSRTHLKQVPWDSWGWMTLGLALQRQANGASAAAAFDSAMTLLDAHDRARLDRLERVLPSADSARLVRAPAAEQAAYGRLYWLLADPLWSRAGNESRTEYLARVTFAELRWTVDELNVRGADTDRGDIFIRYGPPDLVAAFGPVVSTGMADASGVSTTWVYKSGLAFVFIGQPTFATSHIARADVTIVKALTQLQPVRWDNLASPRVDSMPTMVSRFRGGRDSVDILVSTDPPVDSIRASTTLGIPVRGDVWFLNANAAVTYHDSVNLATPGIRSWSRRVAPGAYLLRLEASAENAMRAGRSTGIMDAGENPAGGLPLHGFGLSDLLITTKAEPRGTTARRWNDLVVSPSVGTIPRGSSLVLVWENYDFGARDGNAQYEVAVTVARQQSVAGRIGASIVGSLASIARINHGDDRVTISFERALPHAPAFVDYITLALSDTPAGSYSVTLQVTDHVTGTVVTRTRNFSIRE